MEILRLLLARGADVALAASDGRNPLHRACYFGHEACARLLIDAKAAVDAVDGNGDTALILTCQNGHEACARIMLIDEEAPVNAAASSTSCAHEGLPVGHEACARMLIDAKAAVDAEEQQQRGQHCADIGLPEWSRGMCAYAHRREGGGGCGKTAMATLR